MKTFLNEKSIKTLKQGHAFKAFASTDNVEILNYFDTDLKFKDTQCAIISNLIEFFTHLKGFKFVTTLFLVFKKIECEGKNKL